VKLSLPDLGRKARWSLVAGGAATVSGIAARRLLEAAWRRSRGEDPPKNPASSGVGWTHALAWTFAAAGTVAVARLVARRAAAAGWRRALDEEPPVA
jgi:hypothetical protein